MADFKKIKQSALERQRLKRAEEADLVTLPTDVQGTNCGNCKFVDAQNSFCNHPSVLQKLKDGVFRMCCALWDRNGTKREWKENE